MLGVFGVISNIVQAIEVDHYSHVIGTRQTHQVGADAEGANGCYPGVSKPRHLDPSVALFPRHVGFDLEQYYVADHVPISLRLVASLPDYFLLAGGVGTYRKLRLQLFDRNTTVPPFRTK